MRSTAELISEAVRASEVRSVRAAVRTAVGTGSGVPGGGVRVRVWVPKTGVDRSWGGGTKGEDDGGTGTRTVCRAWEETADTQETDDTQETIRCSVPLR